MDFLSVLEEDRLDHMLVNNSRKELSSTSKIAGRLIGLSQFELEMSLMSSRRHTSWGCLEEHWNETELFETKLLIKIVNPCFDIFHLRKSSTYMFIYVLHS